LRKPNSRFGAALAAVSPEKHNRADDCFAGERFMSSSDSRTHPSLLQRLRHQPADDAAWAEFVAQYGGKIYGWCRQAWGLQEADARDISQEVLLKLAAKMRDFAYDPGRSFRAWLRTVAQRTWLDFRDSRRRLGGGSGDPRLHEMLESVAAPDELGRQLESEYERELLAEAAARVRSRVAPKTWEAFHLAAQEGLPGAEVSARVGLPVSQVFVARHRVQKLLRAEIARVEAEADIRPQDGAD
jgi:RNA polymerase sigma factor (sigma-70 family)